MRTGPLPVPYVRDCLIDHLIVRLRNGTVSRIDAAFQLEVIQGNLRRKPPISVAPRRIRPLTDEQKAHLRQYAKAWPDMSQLELANRFNTNPGRVSEALNEGP